MLGRAKKLPPFKQFIEPVSGRPKIDEAAIVAVFEAAKLKQQRKG